MSLILILILPLVAAALCGLARDGRAGPVITLTASAAVLILAARVAFAVAAGSPVVAVKDLIAVDGLSALIMVLVALVGTTAAIYSWGYMAAGSHESPRLRLYYASYNLFIFSMLAIPLVVEPTLVWIFVELTTLSSAMLVSYENTQAALEAAWKYVALSLMGAAVALLGFLVLFAAMQVAGGGPYTWSGLLGAAPRMPAPLLETAFLLVLVGFGTKVGLVPLHTWLPDAHSQAPSPVCALLSGIETTAVLYVILRFVPVLKAAPGLSIDFWAVAFGLVSVGTAAFLLLQVRDYKRLFAYSTVEHMGIILVATGFASAAASYGAMYQVLAHTLSKSFCFFAAGAVLLATGSREIAAVRGLIRVSPVAAASLLLGGLAIAGAPPFAVFLGEFSIFKAGLAEGRYVATALLALFIAIGFFGTMRHINRMVFGAADSSAPVRVRLPVSCVTALGAAAVLVVALGMYVPARLDDLLRLAAAAFTS